MSRFTGEMAGLIGGADRLFTRITQGVPYNYRLSDYDPVRGSELVESHHRPGPTGYWTDRNGHVIICPINDIHLRTDPKGKILERYTYVDLEREGSLRVIDASLARELMIRGT